MTTAPIIIGMIRFPFIFIAIADNSHIDLTLQDFRRSRDQRILYDVGKIDPIRYTRAVATSSSSRHVQRSEGRFTEKAKNVDDVSRGGSH